MATTYSQSATIGLSANSPFAALQQTTFRHTILPDSSALVGGQQLAAATGAQILCLMPDGSQKFFTIDAERSRPGAIVLVAV